MFCLGVAVVCMCICGYFLPCMGIVCVCWFWECACVPLRFYVFLYFAGILCYFAVVVKLNEIKKRYTNLI
jgi:hypothetical protein